MDLRCDRNAFAGEDSPIWTDWWAVRGSVNRGFESGSLGIEGSLDRRFVQTDESFAVDASRNLWDGAYGNLRVRVTPGADVLPFTDLRTELFQALAGQWEGSAHMRHLNFAGTDVTLGGGGVTRHAAPWYVELRGSYLSGRAVSGGIPSGCTEDAGRARLTVRRSFWVLGWPETDPNLGSEHLVGIQLTGGVQDYDDIAVRRRLSIGPIASF